MRPSTRRTSWPALSRTLSPRSKRRSRARTSLPLQHPAAPRRSAAAAPSPARRPRRRPAASAPAAPPPLAPLPPSQLHPPPRRAPLRRRPRPRASQPRASRRSLRPRTSSGRALRCRPSSAPTRCSLPWVSTSRSGERAPSPPLPPTQAHLSSKRSSSTSIPVCLAPPPWRAMSTSSPGSSSLTPTGSPPGALASRTVSAFCSTTQYSLPSSWLLASTITIGLASTLARPTVATRARPPPAPATSASPPHATSARYAVLPPGMARYEHTAPALTLKARGAT
mmetsp:Transcript_1115/g.3633  ORF Transcript_1115/g.3633 Transcript_1115/m.3633 type:complete len:281 (+) Transcript_1115:145-987(+)